MTQEDPISILERWVEHGARYEVLELSDDRAVVDLRTCHGESVDRLESRDPRLLDYLRDPRHDHEP